MRMAEKRIWQIIAERKDGTAETYFIKARTLYDAFIAFSEAFFPWNMVGLHIKEAKDDEREKEERPGAAVS